MLALAIGHMLALKRSKTAISGTKKDEVSYEAYNLPHKEQGQEQRRLDEACREQGISGGA